MTPELINKRFVELQKLETDALQRFNAARADLQNINGAKIDCQYWLAQLAQANPPAFVPNGEPQTLQVADSSNNPDTPSPDVASDTASNDSTTVQ